LRGEVIKEGCAEGPVPCWVVGPAGVVWVARVMGWGSSRTICAGGLSGAFEFVDLRECVVASCGAGALAGIDGVEAAASG
jgi:hypothetical protein